MQTLKQGVEQYVRTPSHSTQPVPLVQAVWPVQEAGYPLGHCV